MAMASGVVLLKERHTSPSTGCFDDGWEMLGIATNCRVYSRCLDLLLDNLNSYNGLGDNKA